MVGLSLHCRRPLCILDINSLSGAGIGNTLSPLLGFLAIPLIIPVAMPSSILLIFFLLLLFGTIHLPVFASQAFDIILKRPSPRPLWRKFSCIVSFRSFVGSDGTIKPYILFEWTFREKGKISLFFITISSFANISYWRGFPHTVTLAPMRKISWHQVWGIVLSSVFCSTCLCVSMSGEQCCEGSTFSYLLKRGSMLPPPPLLCLFVVFCGFIRIPGVFFYLHKLHPCRFWQGLYWICKLLWVLTIAVIAILPGLKHRNFISVCLL